MNIWLKPVKRKNFQHSHASILTTDMKPQLVTQEKAIFRKSQFQFLALIVHTKALS